MSSLYDRLLAICIHFNQIDKIEALESFVASIQEKQKSSSIITDDAVVSKMLSDLSKKKNENDDDDDDDQQKQQFIEPPIEVRMQLTEQFKNHSKKNKSPSSFSPSLLFTKEEAEKKFAMKTEYSLPDDGTTTTTIPLFISSAPSIVFSVAKDPRIIAASKNNSNNNSSPVQVFVGEWDEQGVFLYQAFKDSIADYALEHQTFKDCPDFNPTRMTWVKPSFAWMLYRCGYAKKPGQNRVLKIKISHQSLASLLSQCQFVDTNKDTKSTTSDQTASSSADDSLLGRVQWDPERDLFAPDASNKVPREMLRRRAIQIGLQGRLSAQYVESILSIEDCTSLAHQVGVIHQSKSNPFKTQKQKEDGVAALSVSSSSSSLLFPKERPYFPALCSNSVLVALGMLPGVIASAVAGLGRGKVGGV